MPAPLELSSHYQRVAVTGANGQLGAELVRRLGPAATPLTRHDCNLTDAARVRETLLRVQPDLIINCAAYTAVDKAESDEKTCFAVNADAVETLAAVSNELSAPLVQISTDYVFGADSERQEPYRETDAPGPINVYGHSKLAGEAAAGAAANHLIVRTCGLYSASPDGPVRGRNFCDTMLALARDGKALRVVDDQWCTPTYVPHFATLLLQLIAARAQGIVHGTAAGRATWYRLAKELFRAADLPADLTPITTNDYPTPASRPASSLLCGERCEKLIAAERPDWKRGATEFIGRNASSA